MDENKKKNFKVEIEFDDDFDTWLNNHEAETKVEAVKPLKPSIPAKPAAPVEPPKQTKQPVSSSKPAPQPARHASEAKPQQPIKKTAPVQPPIKRTAPVQPPKPSSAVDAPVPKSTPKPVENMADVPVSRRETVKNFKLQIDEEAYNAPAYEEPVQQEKRKSDKAVYFAARQPSKAQLAHRRAQEEARQENQRREKQQIARQRKKESDQVVMLSRVIMVGVIVVVSLICSIYTLSCINDVLALNRNDELVEVTIEKDQDYKSIIDTLGDAKLIKHEWFCKLMTKFRHFDQKSYINGVYFLTADMGVEGMLSEMTQTQSSNETVRLSFPEGWTIPQIFKKLEENNVCPADYLYTALREVEFDYDFVSNVPTDNGRCFALEGYLFPDTYDFFVSDNQNGMGENPNSVIRKFLANFESKWSEVYEKRAQELGLTMDEVIIIASIIQKEAADESQMEDISSVIHNRLNNKGSYPTLGCDSTKKYVENYLTSLMGDAQASVYTNAYDTNSLRSGLPAGPICSPGVAAIEAALNPSDTNYFYFCHNNKGKIYLASTYNEFQANWAQVLRDNA